MDLLMVAQPTGLWENIIFALESWVGNYAVAIILITILIKLVMTPFDIMNKITTKKNTRKQMEMKPELDKINARYGQNKELVQKKTMELYKTKGYSVGGMCGVMLLYLVVSMLIFFTLLSSLNNISYYKIYTEFDAVRNAYNTKYETVIEASEVPSGYESLEAYATAEAQKEAKTTYDEVHTRFLWIKNLWLPDSSASCIMEYDDFKEYVTKIDESAVPTSEEYNKVMGHLADTEEYSGWNGLYLLCLIAAASTFLSTYMNTLVAKIKAKRKGVAYSAGPEANKSLNIIMPIIMGLFTLFYTSSFGIYIVTSSIFTAITGIFITMLVEKIDEKNVRREKSKITNTYDRKY